MEGGREGRGRKREIGRKSRSAAFDLGSVVFMCESVRVCVCVYIGAALLGMACAQAVAAVAIRGAPTTARLHPAATRDLPPLHIPHMANDDYDPVLANPGTTRLVPDDAVAACGREGIAKHIIPQSKVHDRDDRCDSGVA